MRIPLSDTMIADLRQEIDRTGMTPNRVYDVECALLPDVPASQIYRWLSGETKTAEKTAFDACLEFWRALPDAPKRVTVSSKLLSMLRLEIDRTGIGAKAILTVAKKPPTGMNSAFIKNVLEGRYREISRAQHAWLTDAWAALPDAPKRIEITPALIEELKASMERAGVGPFALLRGTTKSRPDGLTGSMIQSWLNGTAKTARRDHLEFVQIMARLQIQ